MAIDGLRYIPNFISADEQDQLIAHIDEQLWMDDLKRRVQHYGYRYDYRARKVTADMQLGNLPDCMMPLASRFKSEGFIREIPDQSIVNEYEPGQGIAGHIDCEPCFDDVIISLSLLSTCVMVFSHIDSEAKVNLLLEPRSLLVMQGEARYKWKHGIPSRKKDVLDNKEFVRGRRVSVTFRRVILN